MKKFKTIILTAMIGLLGACGNDNDNWRGNFFPQGFGGLACPGDQNLALIETYTGNLGAGANFVIELYDMGSGRVSAIGDILIPDVNNLLSPGILNQLSGNNAFASCLNANSGTISSVGTGAYRQIDMVLQGQNITITLGDVGGPVPTQLTGQNIIGDAYVQMVGFTGIIPLVP